MRDQKKLDLKVGLPLVCVCIMLTALLSSCSKDLGFNPDADLEKPADVVSSVAEQDQGVPATALKFIELPDGKGRDALAGGETCVEKLINPDKGGKLELDYSYSLSGKNRDEVKIKSELKVPQNAVTSAILMSMCLGSEVSATSIDLVFGPHGTNFEKPVNLTYVAKGLDFSGVEEDIGFYYHNEEKGLWEYIEADITIDDGNLKVKAELNHFCWYGLRWWYPFTARYALAISR